MPWDNFENKNVYNEPHYLPVEASTPKIKLVPNKTTEYKKTNNVVYNAPDKVKVKKVEQLTVNETIEKKVVKEDVNTNIGYRNKMVIPIE